MPGNWNECNLNPLLSNHWRASLVPAAAVTPAPIAYIKVVAVKKLVVGYLIRMFRSALIECVLEQPNHPSSLNLSPHG